MTIALVTGAAGFVGARLVRRLLERDDEVHALVRPQSDLWRIEDLRDRLHIHRIDLAERSQLRSALERAQPESIFHVAAYGGHEWQKDSERIVRDNVTATAILLEEAINSRVRSIVYSGSSSEYGFKDHAPQEDEVLQPNSAYAVCKAAATHLCGLMARNRGTRITTLRLYSVYGPYEHPGRLIPALIVSGLLRGTLPPLTHPTIARDFVHIDDVVNAFLAAENGRSEPGAIFNVGSGVQTTLADVVGEIRSLLSIAAEPQWGTMPDRIWDTSVWQSNPGKIRRILGWTPQVSLREGLQQTIEWFKSRPDLLQRYAAPSIE